MRSGHRVLAVFSAISFTVASSLAADRVTVTGNVVTTAGQPVAQATVIVYSAGVKVGYSTYCPTCYPDCGKRTISDANGAFVIAGLSSDLRFRLLVVREGYRPTFVPRIDSSAPARAVLERRPSVEDPARVVVGRLVDPAGAPLRNAIVEAQGVAEPGGRQIYGAPDGLEPLAVTNERGEFEIAYGAAATSMVLLVEARGMAPKKLLAVPTGANRQIIVLNEGAVVRGRVLQGGKPVAGAEMGLYSTNHMNGNGYEEIRVGTKEDGTFAFTNVPTPVDWHLYAKMESISARGAIQPVKLATRKDLEDVDLGDLKMSAGHRLRGRVVLADGRPIADGMRVFLTPQCQACGEEVKYELGSGGSVLRRSFALMDSQSVLLGPDGRFEFKGLASGPYQIMASVKSYGLVSGYSVLRPKGAIDEEKWKGPAEFSSRYLRAANTIEVRVDGDVDDVIMNLEPRSSPQ